MDSVKNISTIYLQFLLSCWNHWDCILKAYSERDTVWNVSYILCPHLSPNDFIHNLVKQSWKFVLYGISSILCIVPEDAPLDTIRYIKVVYFPRKMGTMIPYVSNYYLLIMLVLPRITSRSWDPIILDTDSKISVPLT